MNISYLNNKPNTTYLSDSFNELPENCVFNKVTTGCGASHLALTNMKPTILAVPFRVLVSDKVEDEAYNVLGVSCDYPCDTIPKNQLKIICTYQSLEKVSTLVDISQYNLIIDESHLLLQTASYSPKDIKWLMDNFSKFKSYTFMSATLHDRTLWLPEMRELPLVEMVWDNIVPVKFKPYAVKGIPLQDGLINIILNHLDKTNEGNPYFFYNSLKGITNLVRRLKKQGLLTNKDYRIVCSPTKANKDYLKKNLNQTISKPGDTSCKVNFITSTAFEGVNLYDPEGITYIVSDRGSDYAKYDIVTTVPQIIGRIRDSKHNDTINIIYDSHTLVTSQTQEEVEAYSQYRLNEAYKGLRDFKATDAEDTKKGLLLLSLQSLYYYTNPGVRLDEDMSFDVMEDFKSIDLFVNEYAPLIDLAFFKLINSTWHINVTTIEDKREYTLDEDHFTLKLAIEGESKDLEGLSDKNTILLGKKISFKDLCLLYESGEEALVEQADPLIIEYYKVLGKDKIKAYTYNSTRIRQLYDIEFQSNYGDNWITKFFKVGETYNKAYISEQLKERNAAKTVSTYLKKFFLVRATLDKDKNAAFKIIKKL